MRASKPRVPSSTHGFDLARLVIQAVRRLRVAGTGRKTSISWHGHLAEGVLGLSKQALRDLKDRRGQQAHGMRSVGLHVAAACVGLGLHVAATSTTSVHVCTCACAGRGVCM